MTTGENNDPRVDYLMFGLGPSIAYVHTAALAGEYGTSAG
jgi:hypothetical protein